MEWSAHFTPATSDSVRWRSRSASVPWWTSLLAVFCFALAVPRASAAADAPGIRVVTDDQGMRVEVDGKPFLVRGMNWAYTPIGENYVYSLWAQPDAFIETVLGEQMQQLKDMGVNAIRQFDDIPARWVAWIYKRYGIYTAIDNFMGRYGATINGVWIANIDYANPAYRRFLLAELANTVEKYKDTPGLLMWLLGNENNYGLQWTSFEPQALPVPGQEDNARAQYLYSLYQEAIRLIHKRDGAHPVALTNGDIGYLDLIVKYCQEVDIFGSNVYRGPKAGDMFQKVKAALGRPVLFSEFGADAYDAKLGREDDVAQARYLMSQWQEIYEQSYGKGGVGNAIGGFIFQWADGWWKFGQSYNLSVHDTNASWSHSAYADDYEPGQNNMNEEWFGIAALTPADVKGVSHVRPRTAYYALQAAFKLDPYAEDTTREKVRATFESIRPVDLASRYAASEALARTEILGAARLSNLRMEFDTFTTAGNRRTLRGSTVVFDHTESFTPELTLKPMEGVTGRLALNIVANAAQNLLDPIVYENHGRLPTTPTTAATTTTTTTQAAAFQPLAVYQADFAVDKPGASIEGYYRVGHNSWGYEGDFFGLYPSAYYGPNIDTYFATAPFGAVVSAHQALEGLKVAFGPQLYWGANPMVIGKYQHAFGPLTLTLIQQQDIARQSGATTSTAIPLPVTRRTSLDATLAMGNTTLEVGGLCSGPPKVGEPFLWTRSTTGRGYQDSGYEVLEDKIKLIDTLGAKAKIKIDGGWIHAYAQGMVRGLVSDGGPDSTITFTGWSLKESGRGNQISGMGGVSADFGSLQIAPNVLYQKPIVGPLPSIGDYYSATTGNYYRSVHARNVLSDPFAVLDNRETYGLEMLLVYDPAPITWFWDWDNDARENAPFAGSLDAVYRIRPTSRDSHLAILADQSVASFDAAPPANNAWDLTLKLVGNPAAGLHLVGHLYIGKDEPRSADTRLVLRKGGDVSMSYKTYLVTLLLRFDDWGPYDYYRDFNLTYPFQGYLDASYGLKVPYMGQYDTRFGLRGQARTLDAYSPGFLLSADHPDRLGAEYQLTTYMRLSL